MLLQCGGGLGALAWAGLMGDRAYARALSPPDVSGQRLPHYAAKARQIIFLYMDGAPSQMDTFDPKPRLAREHGQPIKMKVPATQFDDVGTVLQSPWKFKRHGECGAPVSELFPHVATCVDDLAFIRSMVAPFSEHTNANYFLHTGHGQQGRPSMGSWISYGLGSPSRELPGFVVLNGGLIPPGGLDNFNSGFLPAAFQGSVFGKGDQPVANIKPTEKTEELQRSKLALMRELDRGVLGRLGDHPELEAAIANYELGFRMQAAVPELMDLRSESPVTRRLYGLESGFEHTVTYGTMCLLARRLIERGVRFVELTCPRVAADRWDQHRRSRQRPFAQCARRRSADRRAPQGPEVARFARHYASHLGWRVRSDADGSGHDRARPQSVRVHHLARRCRDQGRRHVRRDGRLRLLRHREQGHDPRPPRDRPAPARYRSREADLPLQRPRHPIDRCSRRGRA